MLESEWKTFHYYDHYLISFYSFKEYHAVMERMLQLTSEWREWGEAWMHEPDAERVRFDMVCHHRYYDVDFVVWLVSPQILLRSINTVSITVWL